MKKKVDILSINDLPEISKLPKMCEDIWGNSYHYDGKVLKIYKNLDLVELNFKDRVEFLAGLKMKNYVFADGLVYDGDKLCGTVSRFIPGVSLKDGKEIITINDIVKALPGLYSNTEKLSSKNIVAWDITPQDMILNKNNITNINTDFFAKHDEKSERIKSHNFSVLNTALFNYIMGTGVGVKPQTFGIELVLFMTKFDPRSLTDPDYFLSYLENLDHFVSDYTNDHTNSISSVNSIVRKRSRL